MTQYSGKVIRKTPVTPTQQAASGVWKLNEQAAAIRNNNWPVPGVPNPISRSVRLRSSASAYFNRTLTTPTSGTTWTWSAWVKRGVLSVESQLFSAGVSVSDQIFFQNSTDFLIVYLGANTLVTSQVFRDPSAWYHIVLQVDTTQATASNRVRLYVNGVQVTAFSSTSYPTQNATTKFNSASAHNIGRYQAGASGYFDGYLTEVNFIDGQALTPSSFGTTDPLTGVWEPIAYTGTYGTNGFYLNFKDNTSTTTLGLDYSGNSNNWTANNISVTVGSTYDSMLDVPTQWIGYSTTTDTSAVTRGNYCILNALSRMGTPTNSAANLQTNLASSSLINGSQLVSSGKWYFEAQFTSGSDAFIGWNRVDLQTGTGNAFQQAGSLLYFSSNGNRYKDGDGGASYGASYSTSDAIGCAIDLDANQVTWYKNNVSQGTISINAGNYTPCLVTGGTPCNFLANFGQRPFTYTPPSGYKSLNTTNLPDSTIVQGNKWMDVNLWTGDGTSTRTIGGLAFQPDFIWTKRRSSGSVNNNDNWLYDSVRGAGSNSLLTLTSNRTDAEFDARGAAGNATAITSSGFTTINGTTNNNNLNESGNAFVAWQWKANGTPAVTNTNGSITSTVSASTTSGFSVVTYTGTGANATVGHGLGVAPRMIIFKRRSATANWAVYHASIGNTGALALDLTIATDTNVAYFNNTSPTSSVFTVGTGNSINASTSTYVAYCFAQIAGFSAFGIYTGNGSSDGPFVFTGFRPRFIMLKRTDAVSGWGMIDTARGTYNTIASYLQADSSAAELTDNSFDILSNGFKCRLGGNLTNTNGGTYIYAAFAENPFKNSLAR
jgi:hypothetical protein